MARWSEQAVQSVEDMSQSVIRMVRNLEMMQHAFATWRKRWYVRAAGYSRVALLVGLCVLNTVGLWVGNRTLLPKVNCKH